MFGDERRSPAIFNGVHPIHVCIFNKFNSHITVKLLFQFPASS